MLIAAFRHGFDCDMASNEKTRDIREGDAVLSGVFVRYYTTSLYCVCLRRRD